MLAQLSLSKVVGDLKLGDKKVTFLITWYKASLFGGFVLASGVSRPESMTIAIICSTMLVLRPANHSKVHLYKIPCGTNICCFFQEFTSPIRDSGPLEPLDQCTKRISPWQMIQQEIATTLILEIPHFSCGSQPRIHFNRVAIAQQFEAKQPKPMWKPGPSGCRPTKA